MDTTTTKLRHGAPFAETREEDALNQPSPSSAVDFDSFTRAAVSRAARQAVDGCQEAMTVCERVEHAVGAPARQLVIRLLANVKRLSLKYQIAIPELPGIERAAHRLGVG